MFVCIEEAVDYPPFRLANFTSYTLSYSQEGCPARPLHSMQAVPFAWDCPTRDLRLLLSVPTETSLNVPYQINEIGRNHAPLKLHNGKVLQVEVLTDGPTRLVQVHELGGAESSAALTPEVSRPDIEDDLDVFASLYVSLPALGVSFIGAHNDRVREIAFMHVEGIFCELSHTPFRSTVEFTLKHVQVDNQLAGSQFPVLLAPSPVREKRAKPTLHLTAIQQQNRDSSVLVFEHMEMLLQELDLKLDEGTLLSIVEFVKALPSVEGDDAKRDAVASSTPRPAVDRAESSPMIRVSSKLSIASMGSCFSEDLVDR